MNAGAAHLLQLGGGLSKGALHLLRGSQQRRHRCSGIRGLLQLELRAEGWDIEVQGPTVLGIALVASRRRSQGGRAGRAAGLQRQLAVDASRVRAGATPKRGCEPCCMSDPAARPHL